MSKTIYIIPLKNNPDDGKIVRLSKLLSEEKRKCVCACRDKIANRTTVYAHAAVKLTVQKNHGLNADEVTVVADESGKPYIAGHPEICFNISHTAGFAVTAFSDVAVGVDIQTVHCPDMRVAERFFTQTEREYVCAGGKDADRRFAEIWTKKEAYLKCSGVGLRQPLNSFCVLSDDLKNKFTVVETDGCVICFFDGESDNAVQIVELTEKEIEDFAFGC